MTWLQTASGRAFDLAAPDWHMVDFEVDIPEALARLARFTGHVRSGPYSVAQHCVVGADAIFREYRDRDAAAAFLLHDAHEAYVGDIATPIVWALRAAILNQTGDGAAYRAGAFTTALHHLKNGLDRAIYRAAGLSSSGCPAAYLDIVKSYDIRMLVTERAHLLGPSPQPWHASIEAAEPIRMVGKLTVWPWHEAADAYRERLRRYLPERFGAPSPRPQPKPGPRTVARRTPVEA
jgi:hypothetical protein